MLSIKDMHNRITYLQKIVPMYQEELAGLKMLVEVYANPEYNALKEMDVIDIPQPRPTEPQESSTPAKVSDSRLDGTYTSKRFFKYLAGNTKVRELFLKATQQPAYIPTEPAFCKTLSIGSVTMGKLIRTALDRGWFIKLDTATYQVPASQVDYFCKHTKVHHG